MSYFVASQTANRNALRHRRLIAPWEISAERL
jgi:hypothetical protein